MFNETGTAYPLKALPVHPRIFVGSVLLILLVFCIVILCFVYLRSVRACPMLPVSLDCPFLIAPSVFSNIYLIYNQQFRKKAHRISDAIA